MRGMLLAYKSTFSIMEHHVGEVRLNEPTEALNEEYATDAELELKVLYVFT